MIQTQSEKLKLTLLQNMPLILFVSIFFIFGILSPRFLQWQSLENIIKQASYIGIAAIGITFVLLTAGIDLSVGTNMYLSAVVGGLCMQKFGLSIGMGLLCCLLTGLFMGFINGFLITRAKMLPFVVTLGTMVSGRGLALLLTKSRAVNYPEGVIQIGSAKLFGILPLPTLIFMIIVSVSALILRRTALGRQIYAVGNDVEAARKSGIHTDRVILSAYVFCGIFAALGGFISVAQMGIVNAGFGQGDEFDAIAAAVLGGTSLFGGIGSVFPGTVLGALLIQMVNAGLVYIQADIYLQPLIAASIIFLAVLLDSIRKRQMERMGQRPIRVEST